MYLPVQIMLAITHFHIHKVFCYHMIVTWLYFMTGAGNNIDMDIDVVIKIKL